MNRNLRLLALAVQRYGGDSTECKRMLDDPNYGLDYRWNDDVLARALALASRLPR